jgi:hypothetical protein
MRKAAVVIGVDHTGGLAPLASAASGARSVARWLEGEGFTVSCLTDQEDTPVTAAKVEEAIGKFATLPAQYHLLVVYFSGHGYWQGKDDLWLLSLAPVKAAEAIDLVAATDLAKYSGIPNVVFVSDACRTIPDTRARISVRGVAAFPNYEEIDTESTIDLFKATSAARPAYEAKIDGTVQSVLTAALMAAYVEPESQMVLEVEGEDGARIEVVPNRRLGGFLQRKVEDLLFRADPTAVQRVVVGVSSSEETYIARVRRKGPTMPLSAPEPSAPGPAPGPPPAPRPPPDPSQVALTAVDSALSTRALRGGGDGDGLMNTLDAATETRLGRLGANAKAHFSLASTGFVVHGATLQRCVAARGARPAEATLASETGAERTLVRVQWPGREGDVAGTSVGLRFGDGRAAVLPALRGYIGHVSVGPQGVDNVSYVPVQQDSRFAALEPRILEIERLRALIALALDGESFPAQRQREAEALLGRIRVGDGLDPTLGLYAAHVFSQASNAAGVRRVLELMRADLGADLFDVRLLASRRPAAQPPQGVPLLPFCPLLTQAWSVLAGRKVALPGPLREASPWLSNALWTTFEPAFAGRVMAAIESGELR